MTTFLTVLVIIFHFIVTLAVTFAISMAATGVLDREIAHEHNVWAHQKRGERAEIEPPKRLPMGDTVQIVAAAIIFSLVVTLFDVIGKTSAPAFVGRLTAFLALLICIAAMFYLIHLNQLNKQSEDPRPAKVSSILDLGAIVSIMTVYSAASAGRGISWLSGILICLSLIWIGIAYWILWSNRGVDPVSYKRRSSKRRRGTLSKLLDWLNAKDDDRDRDDRKPRRRERYDEEDDYDDYDAYDDE